MSDNKTAFGPEHTSVASSLQNLATLYAEEGDYTQAELFDQRALSIREKRLLLLYTLATVADLGGDAAQAAPLYRQALSRWGKRLGAEHPQVAVYLHGLAGLYVKQGEYAKAEPLYRRALSIREKAFGPDSVEVGTTLNDLGHLYLERGQEGDEARAESHLKRALTVLETALGDHPKVAQALANLARLYDEGRQRWRNLLSTLRGRRLALSVSIALVMLIAIGGLWSFVESRRLRRELAEIESARADQERRARELEEQRAASERKQAEALTAELNRRQNSQAPPAKPSPTQSPRAPAQTFVALRLSIGVTRSIDTSPAQTLVIPPGTKEVRLRLDLEENDYASYGVSLKPVGGPEIFGRRGLKPANAKSGARLNLTLPADALVTGDYMLTISGTSPDGSVEELSKAIFRVEKR